MAQHQAWLNPDNKAIADASRPQSSGVTLLRSTVICDGTVVAQTLLTSVGLSTLEYNTIVTITATNGDPAVDTWVTIKEGSIILWTGFCVSKAGIAINLGNAPIRTSLPRTAITVTTETAVSQFRITVTGNVGY